MESKERSSNKSKLMVLLPLLLLLISIPLSLVLWLGNKAFSTFWDGESGEFERICKMQVPAQRYDTIGRSFKSLDSVNFTKAQSHRPY